MSEFMRCGFLFVEYATKEEMVAGIVERTVASVGAAVAAGFASVMVLIEADRDCGATKHALSRALSDNDSLDQVLVITEHGKCGNILNTGLGLLRAQELRYAFVGGTEWVEYLTTESLERLIGSLQEGSAAVGLAIRTPHIQEASDEMYKSMRDGRLVTKLLTAWCLEELQAVANFAPLDAAEEIRPLTRLIRIYGPCVTVLAPEKQLLKLRFRRPPESRMSLTVAQARETLRARENFEIFLHGRL